MICLREIAIELNEDRSVLRKWINNQYGNNTFNKIRDPKGSGAIVLALEPKIATKIKSERMAWRGGQPSTTTTVSQSGCFYAVLVAPELSSARMKFGYASSILARCNDHRTTCPTLQILATWDCDRPVEYTALRVVAANSKLVGGEVYDVMDWESLKAKLDTLFGLLSQ